MPFYGKKHKNSRAFSPFKRTFVTSSACFWASGTLPKPHAARFGLSRVCERLAWCDFGVLALAHCSLGAFSTFSRVRTASPTRFRGKCACALLPQRVFDFLALAHCFPGAFLGFARVRKARLARFWGFRVCARLSWHVLGFFACAHCSLGVFSGFHRSAMRCLPSFPAENSRSFGKKHKNSRHVFGLQKCAFIMAIGAKIIRK